MDKNHGCMPEGRSRIRGSCGNEMSLLVMSRLIYFHRGLWHNGLAIVGDEGCDVEEVEGHVAVVISDKIVCGVARKEVEDIHDIDNRVVGVISRV